MNRILRSRFFASENFLAIVGLCLCLYFCYHAVYGNRSYVRLLILNKEIATLSDKNDILVAEKSALEEKVMAMRPGSVSKDLLEERARAVLGYAKPGEMVIIGN
jgi:cell division protein FtsB